MHIRSCTSSQSPDQVQISVYRQDPSVSGPDNRPIDRADIGLGLENERLKVYDSPSQAAQANAQGDHIYPASSRLTQANAFYWANQTARTVEEYRGAPISWAFEQPQLDIHPHKRRGDNAYYNRLEHSINFFHYQSQSAGKEINIADSAELVAHETSHALIDGMRPGYFDGPDFESRAVHEGLCDVLAMLVTLKDPENQRQALEQTGGDLSVPNILSDFGEEMGKAKNQEQVSSSDRDKPYLRRALNQFAYTDPTQLPKGRGDDKELRQEVHSFARVLTGSLYQCLDEVQQQDPQHHLGRAGETVGRLLLRSLELGATNRARMPEIALGMLRADQELYQGQHQERLLQVFSQRNLVSPEQWQQEQERLQQLPDFQLSQPLATESVPEFLQQSQAALGLPHSAYALDSLTTNERQEQILALRYKEGQVQEGLTLAFGPEGDLLERRITPPVALTGYGVWTPAPEPAGYLLAP